MRYALRVEVPGQIGERTEINYATTPNTVTALHIEIDGWMGDDLCAAGGNNYFATQRLRAAIIESRLTGCQWASVLVTRSAILEELQPEVVLPFFWWLQVGRGLERDFDIAPGPDGVPTLVVSEAALECLRRFSMRQCQVFPMGR